MIDRVFRRMLTAININKDFTLMLILINLIKAAKTLFLNIIT